MTQDNKTLQRKDTPHPDPNATLGSIASKATKRPFLLYFPSPHNSHFGNLTRGRFVGMSLRNGSIGYTSVQNNTVANLHATGNINSNIGFRGIQLAAGEYRVGDDDGNTIGSLAQPRSIIFGYFSNNVDRFSIYSILAEDRIDSSVIAKQYDQRDILPMGLQG